MNISVSAAIILQAVITKLKKSTVNWELSDGEKQEILLDWTKNTIKSVDDIIERFYKDR